MDTNTYIASGKLELYVYGLLTDAENIEIAQLAKEHSEINDEIIAIEKAIVALSKGFSPFLSISNYEKIKAKLDLKHGKVVDMKPKNTTYQYIGWAAAIALMTVVGYQYTQKEVIENQVVNLEQDNSKLQEVIVSSEIVAKQTQDALAIIRDENNTVVALAGQTVDPSAYAKVYWNKTKQTVYVDAAGLPEPPEGKVYQVWALKLNPLTPTSIGLLANFSSDKEKIFEVNKTNDAEAFGITLEPTGGSLTPTMEQLYTLGKV